MDLPAYHQPAPAQVVRDPRGRILGRIEYQSATGKRVARDARGVVVGTHDPREGTTRDARGRIVARGDVLSGLLLGAR